MSMAALYIRLSKEDEEKQYAGEESESIKNQRALLLEYAKLHGYEIYEIYVDEDYSGLYDTRRPAFYKMLRDARSKKFDTILCKSQNRFSRNMEHIEKYLHKEFPVLGIRFIGVVDGTDTASNSGKKARQINGLVNEWYCEDLSENIRAVFQKKMREGQYLSAFATFGYQKAENDHHKIVIDPEAAGYVKRIYELYLSGYGIGKIAELLTKERIPTPLQYKEQRGMKYKAPKMKYSAKGIWSVSTIKRILSNPIYIGTLVQGREQKVSYKDKKVIVLPKEQWHITPHNHEAIIDEAVFEKVQKLLASRRKSFGTYEKQTIRPNLFAGKLICGECKSPLYKSSTGRNKAYHYYICQMYKKTKGECCSRNSIRSDELEKLTLQGINQLMKEYLSKTERATLQGRTNEESETVRGKIARLKGEREDVLKAMSNLYVDVAKGQVKESDQREIQSLLEQSMRQIEEEIRQEERKAKRYEEKDDAITSLDYYLIQSLLDLVEVSVGEENGQRRLVFFWNI